MSSWLARAGLIESIQTGTISLASGTGTATATINAVDMSRTALLHLGADYNISGESATGAQTKIVLTNPTTITASDTVTADGASATVAFVAIQFAVGTMFVQRGTVTAASGTATLTTPVNTAKAFVNLLGWSTTADDDRARPRLTLTNATTVTITAVISGATASFEVWSPING